MFVLVRSGENEERIIIQRKMERLREIFCPQIR